MSEPTAPTRPFYVTGGTLKPGEPSYVERRADTELFESLLAGDFCYVLTARQMGKSSLMARTAKRLEEAGVCSAIVDLTQIGSERGTQAAAQWYFGIANLIHRQLGITEPLRPWWQERADLPPVQRLTDFFRELLLAHCPGRVVIFVDEIDSTIGLPFADDFFAALRACFNARATEPPFERLAFVLLGVATPDQLIQDPARTPFNIGKRIDLTDFNPDEARTLAAGLHTDSGEADRRLERILHWTGGHPYLTQMLCRAVRERVSNAETAEKAVDPQVEELFLTSRAQREETNLKHARARLERPGPEGRRLLQLYRRVREGKPVPDQPTSPLFAQLKLAGVVKATDEGRLAVRNRVYEKVFTSEWAKSAMPADRGRQLAAATLAASLVGILIWYAAFQPRPYEEAFRGAIHADAYNVALDAYTNLHANPFSRSRATKLMQKFWEQRALRYALTGKRSESLLCYLQALRLNDDESLRRQARNLLGSDFERLQITIPHGNAITALAFSPNGQTLATGSEGATARLFDAATGKLLTSLQGHKSAILAVAFDSDGHTLEIGTADRIFRTWDIATGESADSSFLSQKTNPFHSIGAFSPNGRLLANRSANGTIQLWNTVIDKSIERGEYFHALAISPDGNSILAMGPWSTKPIDTGTGQSLAPPQQNFINAVTFGPDGHTIVTGTADGTARLWDHSSGKLLSPSFQNNSSIVAVAVSPDGQTLATGDNEGAARLWDTRLGNPLALSFQNGGNVLAVAFSPNGRTLATGDGEGFARLWDARPRKLTTPLFQQKALILDVAFSPDGHILATGAEDHTARLWDTRSGKLLVPALLHERTVVTLAFNRDSRILATGTEDGNVHLWNVITGEPLVPPLQQGKTVVTVAFSPNGRTLAMGSEDGNVRLWNTVTGELVAPALLHEEGAVLKVAFSPDGRALATGSEDGNVRLWDTSNGKALTAPLRHGKGVNALAFSPDGRTLLTGSQDGTVRFKNAITGKALAPPMDIQNASVRTIAFNPNGRFFFVATDHWLNTYSWNGKKAVPLSSQLLNGFWKGGFRFPSDCERCLQVALGDTGNSFHLETLRLDGPVDPPIAGDPKKLLEKWKARLGLKFDDQMRPVPREAP